MKGRKFNETCAWNCEAQKTKQWVQLVNTAVGTGERSTERLYKVWTLLRIRTSFWTFHYILLHSDPSNSLQKTGPEVEVNFTAHLLTNTEPVACHSTLKWDAWAKKKKTVVNRVGWLTVEILRPTVKTALIKLMVHQIWKGNVGGCFHLMQVILHWSNLLNPLGIKLGWM